MTFSSDRNLVQRIDDHAKGLSEWEVEFVASLVDRVAEGRELTEKQRAIAERIDEEKVR